MCFHREVGHSAQLLVVPEVRRVYLGDGELSPIRGVQVEAR